MTSATRNFRLSWLTTDQQTIASRYEKALIREIDSGFAEETAKAEVDSIYIGGGTPSLIPAAQINDILTACRARFQIRDNCEISLEANPGTLSEEKIAAFLKSGVNRISIGAQSFADEELAAVGRLHNANMVFEALHQLKTGGFENISIDLMLGLPLQTKASWKGSLETFAQLGVPHISVYMLDLDDQCALSELVAKGLVHVPEEDLISDMYLETIDFLSSCN